MNKEKIKLELSLEEINVILNALGQLPYVQVAALIDNIRRQGERQLQNEAEPVTTSNGR